MWKIKRFLPVTIVFLFSTNNFSQRIMISPEYLQKGDTVGIVATARKIDQSALQPAIALLKSWGLNVVIGKSIGLEQNQLAGPDWKRATDLQEMLDNPSIKAVWAAKGGYGTVRVIDRLNFEKFKQKPKWIVGFSDVTVLHSHLNNMGYETIHGIMAISVGGATPEAIESLRKALFGEKISYSISSHALNREGEASGELVGGNLSVLFSIMGSPSELDLTGKILYIEDLDEYLYHIDRMMMNLKRNQYFKNIKALIVGGMTSMNDNDVPWGKNAEEIVQEIVKDYKFPVIYQFPAGHIKDNRALTLGRNITVRVTGNQSTVTFE